MQVVKQEGDTVQCTVIEPATLVGKVTCMIVNATRECLPTMQEADYQVRCRCFD